MQLSTGARINAKAFATAAALLAVGGAIFGFATGAIRSWLGDVLIVVFLVSVLAAFRVGTPSQRVIGIAVFAVAVECFQALRFIPADAHWFWRLTLGSTFDPWDMLAYALGTLAAVGAEQAWKGSAQVT